MLSFMCGDTRSSVTHPLLFVSVHANRYGMVCRAVASVCVYVHANRYGMVCRAVASICVYVLAVATVWFVALLLRGKTSALL